jgi:M6 family metalloprotease-like protein
VQRINLKIKFLNQTVTREITIKILLVEFQDVKHRNPSYPSNLSLPAYTYDDFYNLFFSENKYFSPNMYSPDGEELFGSISDYYRIMSDNNLIIDGYVLNKDLDYDNIPDWITLGKAKSYYDNDRGDQFIKDSKEKAKSLGLDISKDENMFLAIIYAGHSYRSWRKTLNPEAFYDTHEYIMGERFAPFAPYREERDDSAINKVATFSHIGIHVHEIGHLLGLDDLEGGFDNYYWCLMSKGAFNGPNQAGACPAPINPYFRWMLGWISFDKINGSSTKKLNYNLITPEVYQLQDNCSDCFFLVEYRKLNSKMKLGESEICDYNSYINGCTATHGVLVWRKLNGHFVKLLHSSGEKCDGGDSHIYPGACDIKVLSPWSDNRPPKMGDYWVPNTKPSLNCGFEIINNEYNNLIIELYQERPEEASPSKPKYVDIIPDKNVVLSWSRNNEVDVKDYKIYKMKRSGKYEYYDVSDTNFYIDQYEETAADSFAKIYAYYRITAIDNQKKESAYSREVKIAVLDEQTTVINNVRETYDGYKLFQNYPNPFNPSTTIKYQIPSSSVILSEAKNLKDFSSQAPQNDKAFITLKVYDILGREVATLINEKQKPGDYEVVFNSHSSRGRTLTSGRYIYELRAGEFIQLKKMLLIK